MREVQIEGLGLCEHCQTPLTLEDVSTDAMDAVWHCPTCEGVLSHVTFGYDRSQQGAQKVKWVGPEGQWVDERPTDNFELSDLLVAVRPSRALRTLW